LPLPDPSAINLNAIRAAPSLSHLLGTSSDGSDLLSQTLYGGRNSLEIAVMSVLIGATVGCLFGFVSGIKGGIIDTVLMRCVDVLLAFPALILALAVVTYVGRNTWDLTIALSFFSVPAYGRYSRALAVGLRHREFVINARLAGARSGHLILRHILPNAMPTLLTFGFLAVGFQVVALASLSFLGLGLAPPTPSWGGMIAAGEAYLSSAPQMVLEPVAFLLATVVSVNLSGDALRQRMRA
ncbi:MAG: ABC transporter permease, partial [Acidimicrobiales bacterium]